MCVVNPGPRFLSVNVQLLNYSKKKLNKSILQKYLFGILH